MNHNCLSLYTGVSKNMISNLMDHFYFMEYYYYVMFVSFLFVYRLFRDNKKLKSLHIYTYRRTYTHSHINSYTHTFKYTYIHNYTVYTS